MGVGITVMGCGEDTAMGGDSAFSRVTPGLLSTEHRPSGPGDPLFAGLCIEHSTLVYIVLVVPGKYKTEYM